MSLLSQLFPILPFDIEQLLVSFLEGKEHASLNITDYRLYKQVSLECIGFNFTSYDEELVIHFIENRLMNIETLFIQICVEKYIEKILSSMPEYAQVYSNFIPTMPTIYAFLEEREMRYTPLILLVLIHSKMLEAIKHCIDVRRLIVMTKKMANECINIASSTGDLEMIKYFCSFGLPTNRSLDIAVKHTHLNIVKYLCTFDSIDPSCDRNSALWSVFVSPQMGQMIPSEMILSSPYSYAFDTPLWETTKLISSIQYRPIGRDIDSKLLEIATYFCSFDCVRLKISKDMIDQAIRGKYDEITKYLISIILEIKPDERGRWLSIAGRCKKSNITEYLQSIGYKDSEVIDMNAAYTLPNVPGTITDAFDNIMLYFNESSGESDSDSDEVDI